LLYYYWLQVAASTDHHQANTYKKPKNAGAHSTKNQFVMLVYILYILAGFNTWFELPEYDAKAPKRTGVLRNGTITCVQLVSLIKGNK
jgi:hypothetical protein